MSTTRELLQDSFERLTEITEHDRRNVIRGIGFTAAFSGCTSVGIMLLANRQVFKGTAVTLFGAASTFLSSRKTMYSLQAYGKSSAQREFVQGRIERLDEQNTQAP